MDSSLLDRPALGRRGHQDHRGRLRRTGGPLNGRGRVRRLDGHHGHWRWPFAALARLVRAGCLFVWRRRRLRIVLLSLLLALPPLLGGWLWFRDSSLVSVQRVQISGVHGPDASAIEAALATAARHMTTLDVRQVELRAALAPFRVVRDVQATASFPHDLRIRVFEQLPVAALTVDGQRTAVAADGVVLGPALLSNTLPILPATFEPAAGQRVKIAGLLAALTVLGAAPGPLLKVVERVFSGSKGLTVVMRDGLLAYFGDATRPHAKWLALARVLVAPSAASASYVDVRLPERPAAGFVGIAAPEARAAGAEPGSASASATAAALAAGLATALGGGSSTGSATGHGEASTSAPSAGPTSMVAPEASSATSPQATPAGPAEGTPAVPAQTPTTAPAPGG